MVASTREISMKARCNLCELFPSRTVLIRSPFESDICSEPSSADWPDFLLDQENLTEKAMISGISGTEVTPRKKCPDITSNFPQLSGPLNQKCSFERFRFALLLRLVAHLDYDQKTNELLLENGSSGFPWPQSF